ncbi:MAG: phenylacetate-CoA oxygenase subunit PaaC [Bacteroidia bacterium]|nr:phenylacetate-CoA oxygenase subunit PaaC [Bacteroidia bacterium]
MITPELSRLIIQFADDDLFMGHRNSEWTGLGPILEEDIAFSSMAQDQLGHALAWFTWLHEESGFENPDIMAFARNPTEYQCCHLTQFYTDKYEDALIRQFLYDYGKIIWLEAVQKIQNPAIAGIASRILKEMKYHLLHANTWILQLGKANTESNERLQHAINQIYPKAYSLFEPTEYINQLCSMNILPALKELTERWQHATQKIITQANLTIPKHLSIEEHYGGRSGNHTKDFYQLIEEMTEVFRLEPNAKW